MEALLPPDSGGGTALPGMQQVSLRAPPDCILQFCDFRGCGPLSCSLPAYTRTPRGPSPHLPVLPQPAQSGGSCQPANPGGLPQLALTDVVRFEWDHGLPLKHLNGLLSGGDAHE